MKLYLVFQNSIGTYDWRKDEYIATEAEFQGVFDSKEKAEAICINNRYWIGVAKLNEAIPDEKQEWEDAYYPHEN